MIKKKNKPNFHDMVQHSWMDFNTRYSSNVYNNWQNNMAGLDRVWN